MDDSCAEWRHIPEFSGYRVNALGQVLGVRRKGSAGGILKHHVDPKGYPTITMYRDDGKRKTFRVHNVVALVFHGPRPPGKVARHYDGDPMNNTPGNIIYGTRSENEMDKVRHGTHNESRKTHCRNGHPLSGDNLLRNREGSKPTHRRCKQCHRTNIANYRARQRALSG